MNRQPFPGPGLAIRIIGEVTKEKADRLRQADFIFRDELVRAGEDRQLSQYFAVLTDRKVSYTSGRISTQYRHDFTYGLFEARLKVPKGKGFLPGVVQMPGKGILKAGQQREQPGQQGCQKNGDNCQQNKQRWFAF